MGTVGAFTRVNRSERKTLNYLHLMQSLNNGICFLSNTYIHSMQRDIVYIYIKRTNVMQLGSMFISNCNIALHVSDAICVHLQEHLETVVAASGE